MSEHVRVAVIGGGIIGCGLLYYLARAGAQDTVLIEANQLTSGTTWASSALITHFCSSPFVGRLHRKTLALFDEIKREFGQAPEFHATGSLRLAMSDARLEEYRRLEARSRAEGFPLRVIGPDEVKALHPFIDTDNLLGAAYTPDDGWVEPSSATNALAAAARTLGAKIMQNRAVRGLRQLPDRRWEIETDQGNIITDTVVNAAGMWAPVLGEWIDRNLPVVAMERQYYVTEAVPELEGRRPELPVLRDPDGTFYVRQETDALLIGPYERSPLFYDVDSVPPQGGQQCLPDFLDAAQEPINDALARVPLLQHLGIRSTMNVPTSRSPDGNPLVGPVEGLDGMFVAAGFFGGLSEVSVCQYLAQWIVEGEPGVDLWAFDSRRYGTFATKSYGRGRVADRHVVGLTQEISYPTDNLPGGRPARTSPLYDVLKAKGARFNLDFGWEVPQWFHVGAGEANHAPSFGRLPGFERTGKECRAIAKAAGLFDATAAAKIELSGPHARAWLQRCFVSRIPNEPGSAARTLALTLNGRIQATPDIVCFDRERFWLIAEPEVERQHLDLLRTCSDSNEDPNSATTVTDSYGMLILAGPSGDEILERLEIRNPTEPGTVLAIELASQQVWLQRYRIGAVPAWRLICSMDGLEPLYSALHAAGTEYGLIDVGEQAIASLRYEAGEYLWRRGLTGSDTARSAGLEYLIDSTAGEPVADCSHRLVQLHIHGNDAEPWGGEPVYHRGTPVALARGGGYGHLTTRSFALVDLPVNLAAPGTELEIDILDKRYRAVVLVRTPS
ncbi:MAG: FAD-dependent oxidoreductase [Rhodobacteraceae bacterium]|nr:FAD-dependent oxidoreductase [Paracoccaceae bacterium]